MICKECGEDKKKYVKGLCKQCYGRKWKKENKEKVRDSNKKYADNNPEKTKERHRRYYIENKERINKKSREDYIKNYTPHPKTDPVCDYLKKHNEDLKDDPESLSTDFMKKLIGVECDDDL